MQHLDFFPLPPVIYQYHYRKIRIATEWKDSLVTVRDKEVFSVLFLKKKKKKSWALKIIPKTTLIK